MAARSRRTARRRGRAGCERPPRRGLGIKAPVRPDEALARVVGDRRARPRAAFLQGVWRYVKAHRLLDPRDGRVVCPDATLRRVLGQKRRVGLLEMTRLINTHVRG